MKGMSIIGACLVAGALLGCGYNGNKSFGEKLAGVDRIVATDRSRADAPVKIVLTDGRVSAIIEAISNAKRERDTSIPQAFCQTAEFYRGEVLVGSIRLGDSLFIVGDAWYRDGTGRIQQLLCRPLYAAAREESDRLRSTQQNGPANGAAPHR